MMVASHWFVYFISDPNYLYGSGFMYMSEDLEKIILSVFKYIYFKKMTNWKLEALVKFQFG